MSTILGVPDETQSRHQVRQYTYTRIFDRAGGRVDLSREVPVMNYISPQQPFWPGDRVLVRHHGEDFYAAVNDIELDSYGWDVEVTPEQPVNGDQQSRWVGVSDLVLAADLEF